MLEPKWIRMELGESLGKVNATKIREVGVFCATLKLPTGIGLM